MTSALTSNLEDWSLMGQAELPTHSLFCEDEMELGLYRRRTVALLRRYFRASVEVGRLPSLLGREFFRSRVTSYTMRNFEDVVIFVTDMEQGDRETERTGKENVGHEHFRGIHRTRSSVAARQYPENGRTPSSECA